MFNKYSAAERGTLLWAAYGGLIEVPGSTTISCIHTGNTHISHQLVFADNRYHGLN